MTLNGKVIAAQCCDLGSGACRRFVGTNDDAGCIAGRPPRPYSYSQVQALCAAQGLGLCKSNCKSTGCWWYRSYICNRFCKRVGNRWWFITKCYYGCR